MILFKCFLVDFYSLPRLTHQFGSSNRRFLGTCFQYQKAPPTTWLLVFWRLKRPCLLGWIFQKTPTKLQKHSQNPKKSPRILENHPMFPRPSFSIAFGPPYFPRLPGLGTGSATLAEQCTSGLGDGFVPWTWTW